MAYHLVSFDGVNLPYGNSRDGLGTGGLEPTLVSVAGATHNVFGSDTTVLRRHMITHRGIYSSSVETALNNLYGKLGVWGWLVREEESGGTQHRKKARLLNVDWDRDVEQIDHALVTAQFETAGYWKDDSASTSSTTTTGGVSMAVHNSLGNVILIDPIITLTANGTGAKTMQFVSGTYGIDWTWTGTVNDTEVVTVDCGTFSIDNDGDDAYSGLTLNAAHTQRWWFRIPSSASTNYTMTLTGAATVQVEWYDQWA